MEGEERIGHKKIGVEGVRRKTKPKNEIVGEAAEGMGWIGGWQGTESEGEGA